MQSYVSQCICLYSTLGHKNPAIFPTIQFCYQFASTQFNSIPNQSGTGHWPKICVCVCVLFFPMPTNFGSSPVTALGHLASQQLSIGNSNVGAFFLFLTYLVFLHSKIKIHVCFSFYSASKILFIFYFSDLLFISRAFLINSSLEMLVKICSNHESIIH